MLIEHRPALDPELAALVTAQQRELAGDELGAGDRMFEPGDDVAYLVGVVNGRAIACGGWQALDGMAAEITRMYVRPVHRGQGLARQMTVAIEEEVLAAGRAVVRLKTGISLRAAIALYESAGYRRIPAFGDYAGNPYTLCFEKRLPALVQ